MGCELLELKATKYEMDEREDKILLFTLSWQCLGVPLLEILLWVSEHITLVPETYQHVHAFIYFLAEIHVNVFIPSLN